MIDSNQYNNLLEFLHKTEANNLDLINYVNIHKDNLEGPILVPENKIQRTLGPEPDMLNRESEKDFLAKVKSIAEKIKQNPEQPIILLCEKFKETYYILDGNHTFEALKISGIKEFNVIYCNDTVISNQLNRTS